jgi:hypothetical protein
MWDTAPDHGGPMAIALVCELGKAANQWPKPDTTDGALYTWRKSFY